MPEIPERIQALFKTTKTVCFTRFLIDVPASAEISFGRMTVDAEISNYRGKGEQIEALIKEQLNDDRREIEIFRDTGTIDELMGRPLHQIGSPFIQLLSIRGFDEYAVRTYWKLGNDAFEIYGSANSGEDTKRERAEQIAVAETLRARRDDEIPNEEGVCVNGAFTTLKPDFENIQVGIRLAEFPDVNFSIESLKNREYVHDMESYWRRFTGAEETAREAGFGDWYKAIKQLRKGPRKLGQWEGGEILAHLPRQPRGGGADSHQFIFYAPGNLKDPYVTEINMQLDTGVEGNTKGRVKPSLSDEEAVALWDKFLSLIRVREITPAKPAVPAPGLTLAEGELSPVDGWWECISVEGLAKDIEVKDGRIQYFRKQIALPRVTLSRPGSLWQRVTGHNPTFQPSEKSMWRLVRIKDDEPPPH